MLLIFGFLIFSLVACSNSKFIGGEETNDNYQLLVKINSKVSDIKIDNLDLIVESENETNIITEFNKDNNVFKVNLTGLKKETKLVPSYEGYSFEPHLRYVDSSISEVKFELTEKDMQVDKRVMTFYYPWYRTEEFSGEYFHWEGIDEESKSIDISTNYPINGPYDSTNPKVVERHMQELKEAGVDTLIVSWWGQGSPSDKAVDLILDKAQEYGLKVSLYYEENKGSTSEERINNSVSDLKYILKNYAPHPAYLWTREKPVIFLYRRIIGQVSNDEWNKIRKKFQSETDFKFTMIGTISETSVNIFEGIHRYNYASHMETLIEEGNTLQEIEDIKANEFMGWKRDLVQGTDTIFAITVIPGFDDRKIRDPGTYVPRKEGGIYRSLWDAAIQAEPNWILITSFNEWHEGTEIEPSIEYGNKYLSITEEKVLEW